MNSSTELEAPQSPAANAPESSSIESKPAAASCSSGTCMFSNYKTVAFMIPFLAVTAYSLSQGSSCAVNGEPCAASAIAVGALAGLTSVGLVTAIKKFRGHAVKS